MVISSSAASARERRTGGRARRYRPCLPLNCSGECQYSAHGYDPKGLKGRDMAYDPSNRWAVRGSAVPQVDIDVGLRQYMLRIYNYMASGLALTGIVAYVAAGSGFYYQIAGTPLLWVVMLA